MAPIHVVKLGGSLMDLSDLPERFKVWRSGLSEARMLIVVGGGAAADVVRAMDARHRLGEAKSHWLAIRAMDFNARVVGAVLGEGYGFAGCLEEALVLWEEEKAVIVSPLAWLEGEEAAGYGIGHRWTFTSDSVAGHVAVRVGAARLTMLKSVLPAGKQVTAQSLADEGIVDREFPSVVKGLPEVWVCNLRGSGDGVRLGAFER